MLGAGRASRPPAVSPAGGIRPPVRLRAVAQPRGVAQSPAKDRRNRRMSSTIGRRGALALGAATLAAPALAQAGFPNRPIRLVVPWLPGGSSDTELRVLAELASRKLGQT